MTRPVYLTRAGAERLRSELHELLHRERAKVVGEVADAALQGDRSENAEYIYGKKRLREIDRRIRFLTKRLESAVVVTSELVRDAQARASDTVTVRFGARVLVEDEEGVQKIYELVGPDESDPSAGRISYESPLGKALLKRRAGDVVTVKRPAGDTDVRILSVEYGA